MRKSVLLLLFAMIALVSLQAKESLQINKFDETTGDWVLSCDRTPHVFMYKETMTDGAISLGCVRNKDTKVTNYDISVTVFADRIIRKGDKLALKLDNDEVIMLSANDDSFTKSKLVGFAYIVETTVLYSISESDLQKIINNNVVKIRMELNASSFDGKVYKKKFSTTILNNYKLLQEYLTNENPEDQLLKGF